MLLPAEVNTDLLFPVKAINNNKMRPKKQQDDITGKWGKTY